MSFYFVDRIFEVENFKTAKGIKNVTKNENFLYSTEKLGRFLNPAIISEAVMQLASWLIVHSSDYTLKPVILRIDRCDYPRLVRPGDQIALEVTITRREDQLFYIDADAWVAGQPVLTARDCHAAALSLAELDDPETARKQFAAIYRPEFRNVSRVANDKSISLAFSPVCKFYFIDRLQPVHDQDQIQSLKQFSRAENYFADHFPRKPIVPAVVQLTMVGETAQALASHRQPRALLEPKYLRQGRLRKYIQPGSECLTSVKLNSGNFDHDGSEIVIDGVITRDGERAMQVELGFINHLA